MIEIFARVQLGNGDEEVVVMALIELPQRNAAKYFLGEAGIAVQPMAKAAPIILNVKLSRISCTLVAATPGWKLT